MARADLAPGTSPGTCPQAITRADLGLMWPWAFRAQLAVADLATARHLVEVAEAVPNAGPPNALIIHRQLGRALLTAAEHCDPVTVEADFRAAVTAFEAFESPVYLGQASEEFGGWLAGQGQTFLDAARDLYTLLGAAAWLARLDLAGVTVNAAT